MKKLILPLVAFVCLALTTTAQNGPCAMQSYSLSYISAQPSDKNDGTYDVRVNLTWDVEINNGNKYTYFHIWQQQDYVPFVYTSNQPGPDASHLQEALGTVIVKDPVSDDFDLHFTYNPDPSCAKLLPVAGTGASLSRVKIGTNTYRFTVENLLIPGLAEQPFDIYRFASDVWSSQDKNGEKVHCAMQGRQAAVNDVVNRSLTNCASGTGVNVRIQSADPSVAGVYQLYADNGTPGAFDAATDAAIGTAQTFTTGTTAVAGGGWPYLFASTVSVPSAYQKNTFWLVVDVAGKQREVYALTNTCATLPVTFGTFTAARKGNTVAVKWQTTYELNVSGFNVQRMTNGNWTTIAFVPARNLANGSSYELTDINTHSGLSQYRIISVDIDGKQKLSEVRSVRGQASGTKITVYPNPTTTGRLSLVFDNNGVRDISVLDMSGRIVKQLQGQKNNNVSLEIMQDGLYQIQIIDRTTGELSVEKVIVKKR
jgi:hypothetical protein